MSAEVETDETAGPTADPPAEAAPVCVAPPAGAAPAQTADISALIAAAVRRIADEAAAARAVEATPRPSCEPAAAAVDLPVSTTVADVAPGAAEAPAEIAFPDGAEGEIETAPAPPPQPPTFVATSILPEPSSAGGAPSVPGGDFDDVPLAGDQIAPQAGSLPAGERIEPGFEAPPGPEPIATPSIPEVVPAVDVAPAPVPEAWSQPFHRGLEAEVAAGADAIPAQTPHLKRLTPSRVAKLAVLAFAGYLAVVLTLIVLYRFIAPPTSALIAYQWVSGTDIQRTWVPIENISPNLLRAVVVSEDWGFCKHYGIDFEAIEQALEKAGDGIPRGASTISMQVIKNLFLTQSKSYVRKAIEIPLTVVAEAVWPKSRMLEIYLNIAEWGPGVFGAEAAAQHHFAKSAARLSEREAALLAASLPNPMIRDAGDPGPRTARKASVIQSRMRVAGAVADCAMPPARAKTAPGWETSVKKRAGVGP